MDNPGSQPFSEVDYSADLPAKNASKKFREIIAHNHSHVLSEKSKELLNELQIPPSENLSEEAVLKCVNILNISQKESGLYGTVTRMIDDSDHSVRQSAYTILQHCVTNETALKALISSGMISLLLKRLPDEIIDNKVIILRTLSFCCPTAEGDIIALGGMEAANLLLESPSPHVRAMSAKFVSKLVSSIKGAGRAFDCGVVNVLLNLLHDQHANVMLNSLQAIAKIARILPEKLLYEADELLPEIFTLLNDSDLNVIHQSLELLHALCPTAEGRHLVNKNKYQVLVFTKSKDEKAKYLARQIMKFIP